MSAYEARRRYPKPAGAGGLLRSDCEVRMKAPYCCDRSACNQGRACPHRASQPSRSSWRASDLAIALIFVGVCVARAAGVL